MGLARFWWGFGDEKRRIFWVAWSKLCESKKDGGLGFRSLGSFNIAMLAKQGWRLMSQPDTLASRLMKARYFPNCSFLDARIGHHPSYVWRSILEGQDILKGGCRWLVGDGRTIKVWKDQWSPNPPSFRLISPIHGNEDAKLAEWIDHDLCSWKESVVRQHVLAFEADQILQIPICSASTKDELVWHYAQDGCYSVKSGYHFLRWREKIKDGLQGCSVPNSDWSSIWKLQVPPKVGSFFWRACSGALPCGCNLQRRVQVIDPTCCRCKMDMESVQHALFFCHEVAVIWQQVGVDVREDWDCYHSLLDWAEGMKREGGMKQLEEMVMISWCVWNERNVIFHGKVGMAANDVVNRASSYLEAYREVLRGQKSPQVHLTGAWKAPRQGLFKVNTDGAILGDRGRGMGAVLRDSAGELLLAGCEQTGEQWEPVIVEAKAIIFGLKLAAQHGFADVTVESDNLQVISMMNSKRFPKNHLGNVGRDIANLLCNFNFVSFTHVRREGNKAAHFMAHLLPIVLSVRVWLGTGPEGLQDVIFADFLNAFT